MQDTNVQINSSKPAPRKTWRQKVVIGLAVWASAFGLGYAGYNFSADRQYAFAEERREEARKGLSHAEDLASAFRMVGKVVEPAVVNIQVKRKTTMPISGRPRMDEEMLRRFFPDRDGDGEPDLPEGFSFPPEGFEQMGTGSGVIMEYTDGKGYILTNNHVAGGAEELSITLADGREITNARVVGADPKTDLAVVEIKADRLSAAHWGNSDELQKGDWIMAFGSPFGYVGSMTHGIVSAVNRTNVGILGTQGYENFIQVDAPINPGNSGGPLVNLKGEVVGINTAIASRNGGFQGIGFSVPSNQAKVIYTQLKEKGKVTRGWLGVSITDVAKFPDLAESFGYEQKNGVLVQSVLAGTPAFNTLVEGDIITKVEGKEVSTVQELRNSIAALSPGTEVKMNVFRDSKDTQVTVKLGEQPENVSMTPTSPTRRDRPGSFTPPASAEALGLSAQTLNTELAERQGLDLTSGALVTKVEPRSPAARAGIRPGDVITNVAGKSIKTADELMDAFEKVDLKRGVRVYVHSREGSRFVFIKGDSK